MSLNSVLDSAGRTVFRLGFEISPIILTGGLAKKIPLGMLPLVLITEGANLITGLLAGTAFTLDNMFAHYKPLPGSTLIDNQFGHYPFANSVVAANAIIRQPLRVSLLMHCPVRHSGGNTSKLLTFTAMKKLLDLHHTKGGTYTILTPSYIYQDCLLATLRDVGGEGALAQQTWQWDFEQPLLTLEQAAAAQSDQMSKFGPNGTPANGQGGVPTASAPTTNTGGSLGNFAGHA